MTDETFDKIYLCRGDYETTWCQDRIDDDDIEYIRADIAEQQLAEARAEHQWRSVIDEPWTDLPKEKMERVTFKTLAGKQYWTLLPTLAIGKCKNDKYNET